MDNFTNIDFKKNEIRKVAFEPLNTPPIGPSIGMTYFDLQKDSLRTWDGTKWVSSADLPIAGIGEEGKLGGIRVGDRLTIDEINGLLSADLQTHNDLTDDLKNKILSIDLDIEAHNTNIMSHPHIRSLIDAEEIARQAADTILQNNIDVEAQRAFSVEGQLQIDKEDKVNKTTVIDINSTNTQYPSAKAVYNELQKVVTLNTPITASTEYRVVTYDSRGLVTGGRKITDADISDGIDATKIADGSISNTEFKMLNNVSSNIQTQINTINNNKANKIDGIVDLVDIRDDLQTKINAINDQLGTKTFSETYAKKVKDLSDTPTVLQADNTHYIISNINILNGGSGYKVNESFLLGPVPAVVSGVNSSGEITNVSWSNTVAYSADVKGDNLSPEDYTGSGTGAKFKVITRYAKGDKVTDGTLQYVTSYDPLVQFSRLQSYVATELANQQRKQILGYISANNPVAAGNVVQVGQLWYQNNETGVPNKSFPWTVKEWDGKQWSSEKSYTPSFNDIWSNLNVTDISISNGYYWFDDWKTYGFSFDPTAFVHTINNETINGVKTFTSTITGNIQTADKIKNQRQIELAQHVTGSVMFDGSQNVTIDTTISDNVINNSMIQNSTIDIVKMADQKITAVNSYTSLPTNYAVNDIKTQQAWLNDFASRLNYLVNNKNTVFVQANQPVPNRTGDIWVTTIA